MQIFFCEVIKNGRGYFGADESRHCIRVLRMRSGDEISFTDGKGTLYKGRLTGDDPRAMEAAIDSATGGYGKRSYRLHLAVSPLKNADRLEWMIEKAVEIGVDIITPLVCERTEKKQVKRERLESLVLSAMKQSVKTTLPLLTETQTLGNFINATHTGKKLIATCYQGVERTAVNEVISKGEEVVFLIGPEGDFTDIEISAATKQGFIPVHMGESRLRTETAGVMACCSVYLANL